MQNPKIVNPQCLKSLMSQISNVANPQRPNPHCFSDLSRVVQVSKWLSSIGGWQAIWWGADYFQAPARRCPPIHRGVSSSIPLPRISLSVCPTCLPLPAAINPVLRRKFNFWGLQAFILPLSMRQQFWFSSLCLSHLQLLTIDSCAVMENENGVWPSQ